MFDLLHRKPLVALWCCALLGACSGTRSLETAQGECIEGQSESCTCSNGSIGARGCGSDSEYGVCQCSAQPTGGVQSTDPTAGAGAIAGDGLAGDIGTDPMAGTGGSAGTSTAGVGGLGGMSGSGGMAASGAGGVGSTGGMSTDPIDAGMAGEGGNSGPGSEPAPGELYGACLDNGSCDDAMLCILDSSSGTPMSYCSTTCGAPGQLSCPRSRGDRSATCVLGICVR